VLRQLLAAQFHSYLNALIVLFCLDQVRTLCGGQLLVARLLFWLELLLACGFLSWARPQAAQKRLRTICLALNLILFFALLANLLGYRDLSYWLGDGTIHSADLAVFLVAGVEVVSGLTLLTLRLAPLSLLASIRENRVHFRQAIFWSVQILASLAWLVMTLDALAILWPLSDGLNALLQRRLALGTLSFRVGGLLAGFVRAVGVQQALPILQNCVGTGRISTSPIRTRRGLHRHDPGAWPCRQTSAVPGRMLPIRSFAPPVGRPAGPP
jgi:hypothetical protein